MTLRAESRELDAAGLTPTEWTLYQALRLGAGEVLSFVELMETATGQRCVRQSTAGVTIRAHISNLRRKLPEVEACRIHCSRGQGYYYAPLRPRWAS